MDNLKSICILAFVNDCGSNLLVHYLVYRGDHGNDNVAARWQRLGDEEMDNYDNEDDGDGNRSDEQKSDAI